MMNNYWWVMVVVLVSSLFGGAQGWVSRYNQLYGGCWFWVAVVVGACGPWAVLTRFSSDLVFDGLVYDVSLMLSFYGVLCWVSGVEFSVLQWFGMFLSIVGIVVFKVGEG